MSEEFITKATRIHGRKYDYSNVNYVRSHDKVIITCPKHGGFYQTPSNHLMGRGCKNVLIEYDGKQHFHVGANIRGKHIVTETELKDTQYKDNIKDCYSKSNNIKLLRIPYTKINIIPQLLEEIL